MAYDSAPMPKIWTKKDSMGKLFQQSCLTYSQVSQTFRLIFKYNLPIWLSKRRSICLTDLIITCHEQKFSSWVKICIQPKEAMMSEMLKVIEILAESDKSWEDAATKAVEQASKTLHGIKSLYIKNLEAKVEDNKIVKYRINGQISFLLD